MTHESRTIYYGDPVDLGALARRLSQRLTPPPLDYVPGKTMIRDAVMNELSCSAERAEELVERLEERGFIRFLGTSDLVETRPGTWDIIPNPGPSPGPDRGGSNTP